MTKILIICTGNTSRSQMAQGFLQEWDSDLEVHSAGTDAGDEISQMAVEVMEEEDIDISDHEPKLVENFLEDDFDYVITVCDDARETCPAFLGEVRNKRHFPFEDPDAFESDDEDEKKDKFREIRDKIKDKFSKFYENELME